MSKFPLSQKYIDFINSVHNVTADFLEGTTASGKTTVGAGVKFMRMVSASRKKQEMTVFTTLSPQRQPARQKKRLFSRTTAFLTFTQTQSISATAIRIINCRISSLRAR